MVSIVWGASSWNGTLHALRLCLSYCYVIPRSAPFAQTHPAYCRMDVYEKPTGRSAWLLGLVALRELLQLVQLGLERRVRAAQDGFSLRKQCFGPQRLASERHIEGPLHHLGIMSEVLPDQGEETME